MPEDIFHNRKILVVDDEERMVRFIRLNLEHDGFQVIEATKVARRSNACGITSPMLSYWTSCSPISMVLKY